MKKFVIVEQQPSRNLSTIWGRYHRYIAGAMSINGYKNLLDKCQDGWYGDTPIRDMGYICKRNAIIAVRRLVAKLNNTDTRIYSVVEV